MKPKHLTRKDRKQQAEADKNVQHGMWVTRIGELMQEKECDAMTAFDALKVEARTQYEQTPPQMREQYRAAWLEFKRKVKEAQ